MKKVLIIMLCLVLSFIATGCLNEDDLEGQNSNNNEVAKDNPYAAPTEEPDGFEFRENFLPSEVSVPKLEAAGFSLSPVDGDKVVYRYYSASEGVNDLFFRYTRPLTWTDNNAFVDVNLKLLDPYVRDQTEYKEGLMNGATVTAENVQNWGDEAIDAVFNSNSLTVSSKKSVAVVEDGVTTGDSFFIVDGIIFGYEDTYTFKIEYHNIDLEEHNVSTVETFRFIKTYMDEYTAYVRGE